LARHILGHEVRTARDLGGPQSQTADFSPSRRFDVFVTVDRNPSFQQNLPSFSIAVIVLQAKTNRLAELRPLLPDLLAAIDVARPGMATIIGTA
jgi:hypothetical protein